MISLQMPDGLFTRQVIVILNYTNISFIIYVQLVSNVVYISDYNILLPWRSWEASRGDVQQVQGDSDGSTMAWKLRGMWDSRNHIRRVQESNGILKHEIEDSKKRQTVNINSAWDERNLTWKICFNNFKKWCCYPRINRKIWFTTLEKQTSTYSTNLIYVIFKYCFFNIIKYRPKIHLSVGRQKCTSFCQLIPTNN